MDWASKKALSALSLEGFKRMLGGHWAGVRDLYKPAVC